MTNPYLRPQGQPMIYGHRGARGVLPENTLEGFQYLRSIGVEAVEFDVQNAAGGVPVVVHDPHMPAQIARDVHGNWLTEPGEKICTLSVESLQSFDMGRLNPAHSYGTRYPAQAAVDGARIPTLQEVLEWAQQDSPLILNIEIKSYAHRSDLGDSPAVLVANVVRALDQSGLRGQALISSFDWRVLSELRRVAPDIDRAYLSLVKLAPEHTIFEGSPWMDRLSLAAYDGNLPRLIAAQGARCWCPYHKDVTSEEVAQAHALGLAVNVWTVNDPGDMRAMIAMGVDGIITDLPELLQEVLAQDADLPAWSALRSTGQSEG